MKKQLQSVVLAVIAILGFALNSQAQDMDLSASDDGFTLYGDSHNNDVRIRQIAKSGATTILEFRGYGGTTIEGATIKNVSFTNLRYMNVDFGTGQTNRVYFSGIKMDPYDNHLNVSGVHKTTFKMSYCDVDRVTLGNIHKAYVWQTSIDRQCSIVGTPHNDHFKFWNCSNISCDGSMLTHDGQDQVEISNTAWYGDLEINTAGAGNKGSTRQDADTVKLEGLWCYGLDISMGPGQDALEIRDSNRRDHWTQSEVYFDGGLGFDSIFLNGVYNDPHAYSWGLANVYLEYENFENIQGTVR